MQIGVVISKTTNLYVIKYNFQGFSGLLRPTVVHSCL